MYEDKQNPHDPSFPSRSGVGCTEHSSKPSGRPEEPRPETIIGDKLTLPKSC